MTGPIAMQCKYSSEQGQALSDAETKGYAAPRMR